MTDIDPSIQIGTITSRLRVAGEELTCRIGDRFLTARLVDDSFVLSGGYWGIHTLSARAADTSAERLLTHWRGYCENSARRHQDLQAVAEVAS